MTRDLTVVDGANAGAWIASRLEGGFGGKVKQQIPNNYDAYVRIFHPARDRDGNPVSWADVAKVLGRTAHREMQWHKLVGFDDSLETSGPEWLGEIPATGELDSASLETLLCVLARYTPRPERCFFGLSTIFAGVNDAYPTAIQLRFPGRDYVVFSGPLSAANQVGYGLSAGEFDSVNSWTQSPSLIWPSDHSWYVASEYDLNSTLVGGSRELIDAIIAAPSLEAWEVGRDDSLEADADKIN